MSGFCPKCGAWLNTDTDNGGVAYCEECDEKFADDELNMIDESEAAE